MQICIYFGTKIVKSEIGEFAVYIYIWYISKLYLRSTMIVQSPS